MTSRAVGDRHVSFGFMHQRPGDGKVAVASARLDGMREFLTVPSSHPFTMRNARVIEQVVHFLAHGAFTQIDSIDLLVERSAS